MILYYPSTQPSPTYRNDSRYLNFINFNDLLNLFTIHAFNKQFF